MAYYSPSKPHYSRRGGHPSFSSDRDAPRPGDRNILEGLHATPIQTMSVVSKNINDKEVKISSLACIGAYNWLEKPTPTIIVPGSPRKWKNRAPPYQVPPDVGKSYKDQNGYRCPEAVLLPLFKAVDFIAKQGATSTMLDWPSVDFITDRNNLRKLLRWIIGGDVKDFRIDTQLAGKKTILFNRWEQRYQEEMPGYTFGFNFEKESTISAPGCEKATGHHRVVTYDLNGLKMIVRHEVDACIPVEDSPSGKEVTKVARPKAEEKSKEGTVDDLINALSNVKIEAKEEVKKPTKDTSEQPRLDVIPGGSLVPQSSIVELTTRSTRNFANFDWKEAYGQLWLSQTPQHFLARHERGRFIEVQKRKLASMEMKEIVASQQTIKEEHIKLRRLLAVIQALVIKHGKDGRLTFVCQGGKLQLYERVSKSSCLPDSVLRRFVTQ